MARWKKLNTVAFKQKLIDAGLINTKHRVAWSIENLKAIQKASGMSLNAFAANVGIRSSTIQFWLDGLHEPTIMMLCRIRHKTGIIFELGCHSGKYPANIEGLKRVLERKNKTQFELAATSGVNKMTINRFLNKSQGITTGLSVREWRLMARALRCTFYIPPMKDMDVIIAKGLRINDEAE